MEVKAIPLISLDKWTADLEASFMCRGQRLCSPQNVLLALHANSERWRYLQARDVTLLVDGERYAYDGGEHHGGIGGIYTVYESVYWRMPIEEFTHFAVADTVEAQIGIDELTISPERREAFQMFASMINPPLVSSLGYSPLPIELAAGLERSDEPGFFEPAAAQEAPPKK